MHPSPAAKETSRDDASVVQDDQFIASEEIGKMHKEAIIRAAFETREQEEARSVATLEGPLGNLAGG